MSDEVNSGYQQASISSLVITPKGALAVTEFVKWSERKTQIGSAPSNKGTDGGGIWSRGNHFSQPRAV